MDRPLELNSCNTEPRREGRDQRHGPHFEVSEFPRHELRHESDRNPLVTVLMPCLNESRTLEACIQQAHAGCRKALAAQALTTSESWGQSISRASSYEILVADNGSTDGSREIAIKNGAKVVNVEQKGYGAALLGGIAAARGKYVVMGDSDCSYDFGEIPRFLDRLKDGYDLVLGNRFAGKIESGAMPWLHRYIGNPLLTGLGRLLFRTPCRDWHCGLRAFDRAKIEKLGLRSPGMEFASEMVLRASQEKLSAGEIPIVLHPDGRVGAGHLRSFRDGWRHLSLILAAFSGNRRAF